MHIVGNIKNTDPNLENINEYVYINIGGSINFVEDHEVYQLFDSKKQAETFDNADARTLHDSHHGFSDSKLEN